MTQQTIVEKRIRPTNGRRGIAATAAVVVAAGTLWLGGASPAEAGTTCVPTAALGSACATADSVPGLLYVGAFQGRGPDEPVNGAWAGLWCLRGEWHLLADTVLNGATSLSATPTGLAC